MNTSLNIWKSEHCSIGRWRRALGTRHGPAIAVYDFSSFETIVDVGGGNGKLLISLLQTYPEPRGVVVDLPLAAERARQNTVSMDLIMLIGESRGGRVRTAEEFQTLLESAGFMLKRFISTSAAVRVIEATPAPGGSVKEIPQAPA